MLQLGCEWLKNVIIAGNVLRRTRRTASDGGSSRSLYKKSEVTNYMTEEQYICIKQDCYIHYFLDKVQIRKGLYDFLLVNTFQADILKLCEGSPTVNQLITMIISGYKLEDNEHNRNLIINLIELFRNKDIISLEDEAIPFSLPHYGELGKTFPAWIIIEVTSKCNLNCLFCYKSASFSGNSMDIKYIDMVIDYFAGKCKNIVLTGGEALMHPQIKEVLEKTSEHFDVSLLTNGLLLSRVDRRLLEKLDHIQVSLYGYNNESYEYNTGVGNGFDILKSSYANIPHNKHTTLVTTVVLNKENVNHIEEYVKAACIIGAPAIHFGLMLPLGKGAKEESRDLLLSNDEINNAITVIDRLTTIYSDRIHISRLNEVNESIPIIKDEFACQAGKTNITINQDGFVRACNLLPEEVFTKYKLEDYSEDVEKGIIKSYAGDIHNFAMFIKNNGYDISDMKCVGFCELNG